MSATTERTVYLIQHLQGYGSSEKYEKNVQEFTRVGFIRCRSEVDAEGKYWEVWLGRPFLLKDELKDKSTTEIERWITHHGPGEISIAVEKQHLGLCVD